MLTSPSSVPVLLAWPQSSIPAVLWSRATTPLPADHAANRRARGGRRGRDPDAYRQVPRRNESGSAFRDVASPPRNGPDDSLVPEVGDGAPDRGARYAEQIHELLLRGLYRSKPNRVPSDLVFMRSA